MSRLEDIVTGASVEGVVPNGVVTAVGVAWHGDSVIELTYKDADGRVADTLLAGQTRDLSQLSKFSDEVQLFISEFQQ